MYIYVNAVPYHLLHVKRLHSPPGIGHDVRAIQSLSLSLISGFVVGNWGPNGALTTKETSCLIIQQTVGCAIDLGLLHVRVLGRKFGRLMQLVLGTVAKLA